MPAIDRSRCPAPRHTHYWTYDKYRCRCPDTMANRAARRAREVAGTQPPSYLDATGTRRRLQALAIEGWSIVRLAQLTGLSERGLRYALNDRTRLNVVTARAVSRVYDRIAGNPGGDKAVTTRAARRGWVDSYHWPDHLIDDPAAHPWYGDDAADADRAALRAEVARLTRAGRTIDQIAEHVGVNPRTVARHQQAIRAAQQAA